MSGADAPPTTAQLHASINFQFKQIDVTATESPSLRKAVKEKYTERAALVQLADNTWVKSMAVRRATKENNKYMLTIGVAPGAKGAHVPPPLVLQEIEDGTLAASKVKQIIFGAAGGIFEHDKVQVEISKLVPDSAKHRIVHIEAKLLGPDGQPTGMEIPQMGVEAFFVKYKPVSTAPAPATENADEDDSEVPFDFAPYAKLNSALRIVEAFGPDATATEMPTGQARVILTEILAGKAVAEARDVAALAAEAEAQLKSEKASPAMSRLTAVHCTGVFDTASDEHKAKAIRQFVMPESVGNSSTPEGQGPQPTQPKAPKRKERAAEVLEEDDSASDMSSDSDEDIPLNPKRPRGEVQGSGNATGNGSATKKREAPPEFDADAQVVGEGHLAALAPPGMHSLEVAKIIFDDPSVRGYAMCTAVPTSIDESEIKRVVKRYNLAYIRLVEVIGETWRSRSGKPAKNKAMLEEWAEGIADKVARIRAGGGSKAASGSSAPDSAERPYRIPRSTDATEDDSALGGQKASEGLTGSKQAASVSPAVAERLHASREVYQQAVMLARSKRADAGAADVIGECPETLRSDLQCVGLSNALVDGPGETALFRRTVPPVGHGFRKTVLREIETAIRGMANTDMTQEVVIDSDVVSKLAVAVQDGTASLSDFAAATRSALGSAAAKQGTQMALVEAWSWMCVAIEAALKAVGAPRADVIALDEISNKVNAPPGMGGRLPPADLTDWIEKVLRVWKQAMRDFRSHERAAGAPMPSFKACIASMSRNLEFKSLKAALAPQDGGSSSKATSQGIKRESQHGTSSGPVKATKVPSKDKSAGHGGGKAPASTASAAESAWPERQHMLPSGKFEELRDAAKVKYAGTCTFFLVAKCSKGSACSREHKRPADFERFLNEHKINLDGSAKVRAALPTSKR